ncbi:cytochrome c [Robbsia sp. Bb-Pol-6]|uniref:Cytochrome c n=1 Tax=Robbsia betulipollinis TaxID=2981849 RepID=A0ABT3ZHR5_9BURK|nr:cytochrome c [Robbsia betulipollinis]MCY0386063.1 cytochrome c [Robbsia betulipollinis]
MTSSNPVASFSAVRPVPRPTPHPGTRPVPHRGRAGRRLARRAVFAGVVACQTAWLPTAHAGDATQIARGAYLARAADCIACHTAAHGQPFGGGYAIDTPFGKITSTNISSDKTYGIGNWSDAQFVRAVREGVGAHGENLYPAMPYDAFTQLRRDDVLAIKAYLMSQPPVHAATRANTLSFPFNQRWTLWFWNLVNLKKGALRDDPQRSAEWNRGRYLVQGLAHCETCHTPRNVTLGMDRSRALGGGDLGAWRAYNITPDRTAGIGGWSDAELIAYLRDGDAPGRASAAGPMAEAVEHSLQYLSAADLKAIVAYLRTVPAQAGPDTAPRSRQGQPAHDYEMLRGADAAQLARHAGAQLFLEHCATCHAATGAGRGAGYAAYPSLFNHSTVGASNSTNLVSVILCGVKRDMQSGQVAMPSFAHDMTNEQIATLANYLTRQFGTPATHTTPADVAKLRSGDLQPYPDLLQQ